MCQVFSSTVPAVRKKLKKNPFFEIFFEFFWSPVSRIVRKNVKGGLWEFLNIHSFAK